MGLPDLKTEELSLRDLAQLFNGRAFCYVRPTRPSVDGPATAKLALYNDHGVMYEFRAAYGWKLDGVLVNTMRLRPTVVGVELHTDAHGRELRLLGAGGYRILVLSVQPRSLEVPPTTNSWPFIVRQRMAEVLAQ